jgi:hypothetical protein
MSKKEGYADLSFLLLLVPFIASAAYALVLWAGRGASALLPESVYLAVTKDPYLFMLGFTSVMVASIIEITSEQPEQRSVKLMILSRRIQYTAVMSLVLSLLAAWYANGFVNVGNALFDLLDGRFNIIFSGLLILFSLLVLPPVRVKREQFTTLATFLCFLAVPAVVYEVGKRSTSLGLGIALVLMAIGIFLAIKPRKAEKS